MASAVAKMGTKAAGGHLDERKYVSPSPAISPVVSLGDNKVRVT